MEVLLIIIALYFVGHFFEKSDRQLSDEASKLPPFTKREAEHYYYNELNNKKIPR